ncbi:enoyl-CoA hydratase/isomerase family protein [Komarekiella sp. 'clone 1']|uniref:Enoyl-CoA hydratase/isomerase family protein n=1 Tax=Komarekiella delphini-convector SJRDD-AB1 TaxID=2593771 RepID=A0AA40SYT8_9NOST|nr:enoyl-CoA hydratase/isomerase family protein [Komarekiella delphini-convector]MBD6617783.1 enoyl-CoA hydratase/isomerase family protein [Komarekiella delphini-convector SJRDD-AB1]
MASFDTYKDRYENLRMERTDSGILTVTMHTNGESHIMTGKSHREFPEAFGEIAHDQENEIVILTGAGENWITKIDFETVGDITKPEGWYNILTETREILDNLCNISVPMIAAVNGSAPIHGEYALLADIILASETAYFQDSQHLPVGGGVVPADGVQVIYPEVLGRIRGHYFLLTMQKISAQEALSIGMVNEVLPSNKLLERAHELAEQLLKIAPMTRRYTRMMMTKKMKRLINENVPYDMGLEGLSIIASMKK